MKDFNKYFIVGTNSDALHDTMNGTVIGELIRCKDCKHRPHKNKDGYVMPPIVQVGVYAWGEPKYDDDESCPYVCEDRWYSCIPSDEQYCDMAERRGETS